MIATLSGVVSEKLGAVVVLDVAGVGYGLIVSVDDFVELSVGKEAKVYVYEHIRENAYDLFGFCKLESKALFELLLTVNGVGPKMALAILSLGTESEVRLAIAEGNLKFIQSANGVGKRVAERVVVDLKDKVGLEAADNATTFLQSPNASNDEAVQALIALGYTPQDATLALKDIDPKLDVETRVREALKAR